MIMKHNKLSQETDTRRINCIVCQAALLDDLVIVGEGSIDYQTMYGKAPMVVANYSAALGIPVLGISGKLGLNHEILYKNGFNWLASINDLGVAEENSMRFASHFLELATEEALGRIKSFIPQH